ncbi:MAG: hypothetical protein JXM69_18305 [Anaerolineae bacterium]|nr:hypothetical protein [Anaerolineae bacterium]
MRTVLGNCGCLILSILLLPLLLIFMGPLLVLAALRGQQPAGPITLNTIRYGPLGRIGVFMMGLAIWLLVWSGLIWVVANGLLPTSTPVSALPSDTPPAIVPSDTPRLVAVFPTEPPAQPSPTFTAIIVSAPARPTVTPVLSRTESSVPDIVEEITATPPAPVTITPTPRLTTPSPLDTPTVVTADLPPPSNTGQPTTSDTIVISNTTPLTAPLTLEDQQAVLATVKEGNLLLREAISLANQTNLENLEEVWQDKAFEKAHDFVTGIYGRYAKPFDVQFEYIIPPIVSKESNLKQAVVVSQESWVYQGRTGVDAEAFEFTYVLQKEAGRWRITRYTYLNLPTPAPTVTSTPTEPGTVEPKQD